MIQYLHSGLLLVRICLLVISLGGYLLHLRKRIPVELAVGLLFAGIGSAMFIAGILHILKETAWLIFVMGLYLGFLHVKKWNREECSIHIRGNGNVFFALIFMVMAGIFFAVLLYENKFIHYDNFSHWGVAAKIISRKDMFPNGLDTNLTFSSYPLGSASFIYFFTEIIGDASEWLQMWSQAILMVGMLVGLFAFAKGIARLITVCAAIVILLCGNVSFADLLVDTLLPVTAIGAMSLCIYYYKKDLQKQVPLLIPYVIFLASIKNSGVLFSALILGFVLFSIPRTKENLKTWLTVAASPVVVIFFWNKHVEQSFDGGTLSKHAMRMDNFQQEIAKKTSEDLLEIVRAFAITVGQSLLPVVYLLLLGLLLLLFCRFAFRKDWEELRSVLCFAGISYLLYQLGMLGMYILTMPLAEAMEVAGYDRYHQTILLFVSGLLLIAGLRLIQDSCDGRDHRIKSVVLAGCLLIGVTAALQPHYSYYTRKSLHGTEREKYDRLVSDYVLEEKRNYLILVDEDREKYDYLYWMTQYLLAPENVAFAAPSTVAELGDRNFDYVILFDDTESNRTYLSTQFGITEEVGYIGDKSLN